MNTYVQSRLCIQIGMQGLKSHLVYWCLYMFEPEKEIPSKVIISYKSLMVYQSWNMNPE